MAQAAINNALPAPSSESTRATADQLCATYQISRSTWWRWTKMPGFPTPIRFGRTVRWNRDAVEAFLTQKAS